VHSLLCGSASAIDVVRVPNASMRPSGDLIISAAGDPGSNHAERYSEPCAHSSSFASYGLPPSAAASS
jgi:hypothetical protein